MKTYRMLINVGLMLSIIATFNTTKHYVALSLHTQTVETLMSIGNKDILLSQMATALGDHKGKSIILRQCGYCFTTKTASSTALSIMTKELKARVIVDLISWIFITGIFAFVRYSLRTEESKKSSKSKSMAESMGSDSIDP
ncbi:MAG: hypothetical protein H0W44_10630 [Gammaproteobacteria bacterium]|nr:hypothetical protein [Gammaproteobacteria bacterium]